MNKDFTLISELRQALKSSSIDFCRAYTENAGNTSADTILTILESHLRITEKISAIQQSFSEENKPEAVLADIHEFLYNEKNKTT